MNDLGRVIAVNTSTFGDELLNDTPAGATTLVVTDAADFSEDGGSLSLNDEVLEYVSTDDETDTITLAAPLAADAFEGDRVLVWDAEANVPAVQTVALVEAEGSEGNDDALEAVVPHALIPLLPEGIRSDGGETVSVGYRGSDLYVEDVHGRDPVALIQTGPSTEPRIELGAGAFKGVLNAGGEVAFFSADQAEVSHGSIVAGLQVTGIGGSTKVGEINLITPSFHPTLPAAEITLAGPSSDGTVLARLDFSNFDSVNFDGAAVDSMGPLSVTSIDSIGQVRIISGGLDVTGGITVESGGIDVLGGTISGTFKPTSDSNQIRKIAKGTDSVSLNGSGLGTINHGLGETPDVFLMTSQGTPLTWAVIDKANTANTVQVSAWNVLGDPVVSTSRTVQWLAIIS